ncbi:MAG: hypothetical protein K6E79_05060 [Pseudobutyrivibrio sp.]|nr:hypothetical protein [Pseudobutyrivibrio sp.]
MKDRRWVKIILLGMGIAVLCYAFVSMHDSRGTIKYSEHLDDTAFTVDGYEVTFKDLAFYILYEERVVEEQARIYNPDSTKDYWNIHSNNSFIQMEAKDAVFGMAVHDYLFYQLAVAEGMDTLTPAEEQDLEFATNDFWEDLLDIQWEKLPCDEDTINSQIRIAAIAEKYQNYLAEANGPSQAAYKYDGYYYGLILEEHEVDINDKLWDRFVMGDITLHHSKINYINGWTDEKEEKSKE